MRNSFRLALLVLLTTAACAGPPTETAAPPTGAPTAAPLAVAATNTAAPAAVAITNTDTPVAVALTNTAVPAATDLGADPTATKAPRLNLEATDPSTVSLAAGKPQLVEFFAFW